MAFGIFEFAGVDGAGKTSVARALADRIGAAYYRNLPAEIRSQRTWIDAHATPRDRFEFYLRGNAICSDEIARLSVERPVVLDRYVHSTLAYLLAAEGTLEDPGALVMPDLIVHLSADPLTIEARLASRASTTRWEDLGFLARMERAYERLFSARSDVLRIDTTHARPDGVASRIVAELGLRAIPTGGPPGAMARFS